MPHLASSSRRRSVKRDAEPWRAIAAMVFVLLAQSYSWGSSALLHAARKSVLQPSSVATFEGRVEAAVSPVKPDTSLTVVWLLDAMNSDALNEAQANLLALYGHAHGRQLRLAVLSGDAMEVKGPFASRTQLERALSGLETSEPAQSGPELLDALNASAARLGSKWSPVLLMGPLPKLDSEAEEYARGLLVQTFAAKQVRVSLLSDDEDDARWAPLFESTGGAVVSELADLTGVLDEAGQRFLQVTWTPGEPPGGFVVYPAEIEDADKENLATVPELINAGGTIPTIAKYQAALRQLARIPAILGEGVTAANLQRISDLLLPAQTINPIGPAVLRTEVVLGETTKDFSYALKAATFLLQVRPAEGNSFAMLGQTLISIGDWDKAEEALKKAAELKVPPGELAESYARLHLGRSDERGALPYLAEALAADGKRQDLWLLQAQTSDHLHDAALATSSYEQGLVLGGVHVADSCSLLRLYVEAKEPAKAHASALKTLDTLPADAAIRADFAECLDRAKLSADSLAAWKSVLAVQPDAEHAHVRVTQLLLEAGDSKGAEAAAGSSLQSLPKSGALYIAKSDAILRQGRIYDARSTLEEGAAGTEDAAVLTRLAAAQEVYGDRAPEAYAHLAGVLGKATPERYHALERGFSLSLRDGNLKQAAVFAGILDEDGHPESRVLLGEKGAARYDALVPGGLEAFGVIARVKPGTKPERFFAEYARQIAASACTNNCMGDKYTSAVQSYLATIRELEGIGKREGNVVSVTLSLNGKEEKNRTQSVLKLLGLQMHTEKGQIHLDRGEKQGQTKKQDILTALEVDEVGMEDALRTGKSFSFEIHDEYAAVYPSAKMWKEAFPKIDQSQFAVMLLHNPLLARLYVGMSTLDRRTVQELIGTSGLYFYAGRPADLISLYGTSFAVEGTRASVPGGATAGPVWSQMVGASTEKPGEFYRALLDQKTTSLIAFFYALSHLDPQHQAFFTANLARTKRFYAFFATLPEAQFFSGSGMQDSSFSELLSSVPIDDDGHVAFPGSPEVWIVAKGSNSDDRHVAKMMKKVSRTASPDLEDAVLLHLADTRYKTHSMRGSELENFLAVARVDAHRSKPLDEESALMLAQHYSEFSPAYPYFTDLTAIDAAGFRGFFNLVEGIARQPVIGQQLELGQMHSLIEWVVLMRRRHVIDDTEAARLFARICERLASAIDGPSRTLASMDLAQAVLHDCNSAATTRGWDDTLRGCLLGGAAQGGDQRGKDYEVVLDDQKAPSLESVRLIVDAAKAAMTGSGAGKVAAISSEKARLPSVTVPKELKVTGKEKDGVLLYDPAKLEKLIADWNQNVAKPQNGKTAQSAQKLASELLMAVEPQVTLALAAPVYAYFFRGTDRVISEDPLFLRKHRYFEYVLPDQQKRLIVESEFTGSSEGLGSHMDGGFSGFGLASALAVAPSWRQGGLGGPAVVAEQIAAIRSATWELLLESDQRLVTLRILAAREWIVASAQDAKLFASLSEETSGLLSLSRRAELLNGIEEREWPQVWTSITLPDLFRLGGNYLRRYPSEVSPSQVTAQLRLTAASNDGARLDILGRIPTHVLGCSHTHLVPDAPYEEYERQLIPTFMAERTAEFKLFLAYRADSLGVQPADLPQAAERLAAKAFINSRMSDYHDWRSLLTAYASITNDNLKSALEP